MVQLLRDYGAGNGLTVYGFANPTTKLPELPAPWKVYRTTQLRKDGADHLLTWHAALRSEQWRATGTTVYVVSRDAALQSTVDMLRDAGVVATFHTESTLELPQ